MLNIPKNIIVHHSVTPKDLDVTTTEKSIERNHKERGFPLSSIGWHIGYHFIIYGNGEVRRYRNDNEEGAHCKEQSMNFKSLGICLIGSFDTETPNNSQVDSLFRLLKQKSAQYKISRINIYPHRHFATYKSCYGSNLSDTWAGDLLRMNQALVVKSKYSNQVYICYKVPDMDYLNKTCDIQAINLPNPIPDTDSLK